MNQILVTDKVFITPEFKRKRKIYKLNFILCIFASFLLTSYCIYASYDRDKSEEVSYSVLEDMLAQTEEKEAKETSSTVMRREDNVIIVVLDPNSEEDEVINLDSLEVQEQIDPNIYYASNGTEYYAIAKIYIPKIDITYPVLCQTDVDTIIELMKIAPCKLWGAEPNEVGNCCIIGHNYRNSKFFSKVLTLVNGDTVEITDLKGRIRNYVVYDKYTVAPDDVECTNQETDGKKELTLITCTNDSKKRVIVKCIEIEE